LKQVTQILDSFATKDFETQFSSSPLHLDRLWG